MRACCRRGIAKGNFRVDAGWSGGCGTYTAGTQQFDRKAKFDVFRDAREYRQFDGPRTAQRRDHVVDQLFGRRGAGGDADDVGLAEPAALELPPVSDQVAWDSDFNADLAQAIGVGTVPRANHKDDINDL